ncbi:Hypothetical predicted protein, partial [Pelobates cultripes]
IFDRFWAKLLTHLQPATTNHKPSTLDKVNGERRPGKPLQGTTKSHATDSRTKDPPGLRAARGTPHRCWPHPI